MKGAEFDGGGSVLEEFSFSLNRTPRARCSSFSSSSSLLSSSSEYCSGLYSNDFTFVRIASRI